MALYNHAISNNHRYYHNKLLICGNSFYHSMPRKHNKYDRQCHIQCVSIPNNKNRYNMQNSYFSNIFIKIRINIYNPGIIVTIKVFPFFFIKTVSETGKSHKIVNMISSCFTPIIPKFSKFPTKGQAAYNSIIR